jgi:hypothetical protein
MHVAFSVPGIALEAAGSAADAAEAMSVTFVNGEARASIVPSVGQAPAGGAARAERGAMRLIFIAFGLSSTLSWNALLIFMFGRLVNLW